MPAKLCLLSPSSWQPSLYNTSFIHRVWPSRAPNLFLQPQQRPHWGACLFPATPLAPARPADAGLSRYLSLIWGTHRMRWLIGEPIPGSVAGAKGTWEYYQTRPQGLRPSNWALQRKLETWIFSLQLLLWSYGSLQVVVQQTVTLRHERHENAFTFTFVRTDIRYIFHSEHIGTDNLTQFLFYFIIFFPYVVATHVQ